jgi:hypothetical protein
VLTRDIVECCAGVCEQRIRHIYGIVLMQGPHTTPSYEHALRSLHSVDFINVIPLQKNSNAAYFYIRRQSTNLLRVVHYLANHMKKRIPSYVTDYDETHVCSGNQILAAAMRGDCLTVVATKWTNKNDNLYSQAAR